ncbi:acetyl-CoA hydrolase/transferase family protein [Ravibacter arvi]|uniref:Acetyl-CoA hydrolase/transferase family protein n=1 Tax=Ravibacter arvi TaxID=2051041 RepID=A0ABP8MDD6_9BACT
MLHERIHRNDLLQRVISREEAASRIKNGMVVATSGFTKAGDSKEVLPAVAERALTHPLKITLMTGASLGHGTDGKLAEAGALAMRLPFQVDPVLRRKINDGEVLFIDQHLSETAEYIKAGHFPPIDYAIIEAAQILADGSIVPTTSVGNSAIFCQLARRIIIEVNTVVPLSVAGVHDIFSAGTYPNRTVIPILSPDCRIGRPSIPVDPEKIEGIVITNIRDSAAEAASGDASTAKIAGHLMDFFSWEVTKGRLKESLQPLQAGIGKVANSILRGFVDSRFHDLTMYSEVLQDSTFDLFDAGKLNFASGSSITLSESYYDKVFGDFGKYKNRLILRPQEISNSVGVIRRLGVISINTALECDIYGNVNSTHVTGTHMMNGIGGSEDFARNSYLSIFVTSSVAKGGAVSSVVPMVSHVDHTEHDVDIIVTDEGLADLRGLSPRQRARVIIENTVHRDYRERLQSYFERAVKRGGHTPHLLEEALSWHRSLQETGRM